ncbi:acyl-CoA thioesterase [Oceanobacillus piezotolerans]|uniref:Acyl-CoA thioesterase n=1 Tax=Oceanobacillus piezotolerans TaxID=2448030 RepID=A0A498DCZ2_9BACI|nr:acyl-CoA thioesterase [Oceanobacillus piezotolerans]RLL46837.1 acyl-CoA thioesterase [Oceanobacillus piezotolerans]
MTHEIEVYVRFSETDALGHVNNVSYLIYFEEARTKFFDEVCGNKELAESFILASVTCDYLSQAFAAQILKIETRVSRVGKKSFTVEHLLKDKETNGIIAKGTAVLVAFDYKIQKTISIPSGVRSRLENRLVSN